MKELPKKIKFISDDTEVEFVESCFFEKKKNSDKLGKYRYTKAQVNLGKEVILSLDQIKSLQDCGLLIIIS